MFKNFDWLAAVLLAIWFVAAALSTAFAAPVAVVLWVVAAVGAGGFLHQMEWL